MKVAVVGTGLTGAFVGYLLARAGADVVTIDPEHTPGRASDVNPGGLNPLHGPGIPGPLSQFALDCQARHRREWPTIAQLSGIAFQPRNVRRIMLATTPDEVSALAATEALYNGTEGFSAQSLGATALAALAEGVGPAVIGGLLTEGNATVDSAAYTRALVAAAGALGATHLHGNVTDVRIRGRDLIALRVDDSEIVADQVVFCTGPRRDLDSILGEPVGVGAKKGQLLIAELDPGRYRHDFTWRQFGLYHAGGHRFWLGGTREEATDTEPTAAGAASILDGLSRMLPAIADARIVDQQCGLRPWSADGLPVVGRLRNWDNGYVANGGGAKGVLFSAGMAAAVAALVLEGRETPELALFSPDRFAEQRVSADG